MNWKLLMSTVVVALLGVLAFAQDTQPKGAEGAETADAAKGKWAEHTGDLPFVIGHEKGMAEVALTGKPPMYFFTTTWWGYCKKLAGSAFKNKDIIEAMQHFTPILVDGDTEKGVTGKYGVSGYPTTIFASTKGEAIEKVVGFVDDEKFLSKVGSSAKKAKQGKGSKQYRALVTADQELTKALAKENVKAAFAAIKKAEAVKLDHALLERARASHADLIKQGEAALAAAQKSIEAGDSAAATKVLSPLSVAYKGTEVGTQAQKLLAEIKAAAEK